MTRWKAATIHLSLSAVLATLVGALFFLVWYPPPLFHAAGADTLMLLVVGADLILGPLLTLIVFRSGKRGMKFDLAVIGTMQVAALVYGMSVVLMSRPVFLVGAVHRFMLVSAIEISPKDLALGSKPEFRSLSWTGPRLIGARLPTDVEERNKLVLSGPLGQDIDKFPKYYVDYADATPDLLKNAMEISELRTRRSADVARIDAWLAKHDVKDADVVWLPLIARKQNMSVVLRRSDGEMIGVMPVPPR